MIGKPSAPGWTRNRYGVASAWNFTGSFLKQEPHARTTFVVLRLRHSVLAGSGICPFWPSPSRAGPGGQAAEPGGRSRIGECRRSTSMPRNRCDRMRAPAGTERMACQRRGEAPANPMSARFSGTCVTARPPGVPVMTSSGRFKMRCTLSGHAGRETVIIQCDARLRDRGAFRSTGAHDAPGRRLFPCRGGDACSAPGRQSSAKARRAQGAGAARKAGRPRRHDRPDLQLPIPGSIPVPSSDPAGPPSGVPRACRRHAWNPRPAATKARSLWTWSGHTSITSPGISR